MGFDQGNLSVLSTFLEKNAILYQFLYGNLFPKCFSRINDYGVRAKTLFNTYYQNFNVQKKIINWQNNNLQIKEDDNESTPINMTTLEDENNEIVTGNKIKNENENNNSDNDTNKENLNEKKEKKKTTRKRKTDNTEAKKRKRELKKQKLLKQLNENTEKLEKLKRNK